MVDVPHYCYHRRTRLERTFASFSNQRFFQSLFQRIVGNQLDLVAHFLDVLCAQSGRPVPKVTAGAMTALSKAPWTGNVRELRNAVERLLIFCPAGKLVDEALVQKFGHLG